MHLPRRKSSALMLAAFFLLAGTGGVRGGEDEKLVQAPPVKATEPWEIKVGGPGWLANASGITGFHGFNQRYQCRCWTTSQAYQRNLCIQRRGQKRAMGCLWWPALLECPSWYP